MKIYSFTFLLLSVATLFSFGQNMEQYKVYVKEAYELYQAKDFEESAATYEQAFEQLDGKAYSSDRYNAACSFALAENANKSFYHLFYLAENPKVKYHNYSHISTDRDLITLHEDKRWDSLLTIVQANKKEHEKNFDKPLVAKLDTIRELDQKYRMQISEVKEKHGMQSEEMKALWKTISEADSANLIEVKKILDERGWLGSDVIGERGNSTLFLVIQHSDLETQLKYLPMMREAVKQGNARGNSLALLEDRVALRQGEKQIYGSQISYDNTTNSYFVSPMIEPEKVNERRAEVGLGPIEDYVNRWSIEWDVEKFKARMKELESKEE